MVQNSSTYRCGTRCQQGLSCAEPRFLAARQAGASECPSLDSLLRQHSGWRGAALMADQPATQAAPDQYALCPPSCRACGPALSLMLSPYPQHLVSSSPQLAQHAVQHLHLAAQPHLRRQRVAGRQPRLGPLRVEPAQQRVIAHCGGGGGMGGRARVLALARGHIAYPLLVTNRRVAMVQRP